MKGLLVASVILSLSATVARAERIEQRVTKETQEKLGLDFALSAERDRDGEVQVKLDIPHTGKLTHLLRVELWVMSEDPRKPALVASLKPHPQDESTTRVFFRLQSDLADKTYLSLVRESDEDPTGYQVALRGYVHDRKQIDEKSRSCHEQHRGISLSDAHRIFVAFVRQAQDRLERPEKKVPSRPPEAGNVFVEGFGWIKPQILTYCLGLRPVQWNAGTVSGRLLLEGPARPQELTGEYDARWDTSRWLAEMERKDVGWRVRSVSALVGKPVASETSPYMAKYLNPNEHEKGVVILRVPAVTASCFRKLPSVGRHFVEPLTLEVRPKGEVNVQFNFMGKKDANRRIELLMEFLDQDGNVIWTAPKASAQDARLLPAAYKRSRYWAHESPTNGWEVKVRPEVLEKTREIELTFKSTAASSGTAEQKNPPDKK